MSSEVVAAQRKTPRIAGRDRNGVGSDRAGEHVLEGYPRFGG